MLGPFLNCRLALLHYGGPARGATRGRAVGPRGHQVDDRCLNLVVCQLKNVLSVLKETMLCQERAKLSNLVEEQVGIPMFAIEFVALDIRKHAVRQRDHLVIGSAFLINV